MTISTHDTGQPLSSPAPETQSGTGASASEIVSSPSRTPDDRTTEPQATRLEQCPHDATVLVRDDSGLYCVVCGYPRSKQKPTRPPELDDYLGRLRRGEGSADAKGLAELARKLGLRWGKPELTPDRSLKFNVLNGPILAVQEAIGSDKYLVVLCGEVNWSTGLLQFFKVEEGKGPPPARVRLAREAMGQLIGGKSLHCPNPGELEVVARKPKSEPKAAPLSRAETTLPPVPPGRETVIHRGLSPRAIILALTACVTAVVLTLWLMGDKDSTSRSRVADSPTQGSPVVSPSPLLPPVEYLSGTGSLEVRVNCPALGNLDGLVLPETGKQRSSLLVWRSQPARAHSLKISCAGHQDHTEKVTIQEGKHKVFQVTLR